MTPDWRAYFADGTTQAGSGPPRPWVATRGLVAVVQRDPADGSRHVLSGHDWYWYDPGDAQWYGGDVHGMVDFIGRTGLVVMGRYVPNAQYDRITHLARNDPEFAGPGGREHFNPKRDAETRANEG